MSQTGRTLNEEVLNAFSHLPVAILSLVLLLLSCSHFVFLTFSFFTFFFSFLYHISRDKKRKMRFRKLDVASIFWLIAASVFHFLPLGISVFVFTICAILSVPVIRSGTSTVFTDIALVILATFVMILVFIFSDSWQGIGLGVFFYGLGLPFYLNDKKKWSHLIWHIFVIAGWITHLWAHL